MARVRRSVVHDAPPDNRHAGPALHQQPASESHRVAAQGALPVQYRVANNGCILDRSVRGSKVHSPALADGPIPGHADADERD